MKVQIEELPKITRNFAKPARTRIFKGGRGSGKTRGLALRSALRIYQLAEMGVEGVFLASREHLNSLDESSMEEIKAAIRSQPWLEAYFDIGEKYIRTRNRRIQYAFAGLRHNLDSIKSKARIIGNWTDEAENVSEVAWRKLIPTLRDEGPGWHVENWISYNPESPDSATHRRFIEQQPEDCIVTEINWSDNPWFPDVLNRQRLEDQRLRPETYDHVWEGAFLTLTDAQIFAGKVDISEFKPQPHWGGPYQGGDFGFSQDPAAAVRCWVGDGKLWIEYEAGRTALELDDYATYIGQRIPEFEKYTARWDSAQPGMISHIKRHGLPRSEPVEKWKGSVEDGIAFMRNFEKIVVHPRCEQTAREFRLYSYKVDRLSGDVLPVVVDAHNHYCVAEGQIVETARGPVPIEAVAVGDMVLTRAGYRAVTAAGVTGFDRQVLSIETTCGTVVCTPDHRVFVDGKGFIRADAVRYSDIVNGVGTWQSQRRSSGAGRSGDGGRKPSTILTAAISSAAGRAASIISTARFGKTRTALSRLGSTFITLMATPPTMIRPISSAFRARTTKRNTRSVVSVLIGRGHTWHISGPLQRLGTLAKKAAQSTEKLARLLGLGSIPIPNPASTAAVSSSRARSVRGIASAQTPANRHGDGLLAWMMKRGSAEPAEPPLRSTDTAGPHVVAGYVLSVSDAGRAKRVYDLTIDGEHEFFAGGVLVHNCDAIRYAIGPLIKRSGAGTSTVFTGFM